MRVRVLLAVLAVGLGLVACSGDDGEPAAATLPSVTATPSPSAAAQAVPAEASAASPSGAEQFVRFFYAQLERAYADAQPDTLRPLVAPDCLACRRIVASLTRLHEEGLRVRGHAITVKQIAASSTASDPESAAVTAVVDFGEYVEVAEDGAEVYREPAAHDVVQDVILRRHGDGWLVASVTES